MSRPLLFVEDDRDDQELTVLAFQKAGLEREIALAGDGQDALDYLRRASRGEAAMPCAILADVKMPRMGGVELLARVRANQIWAAIPFVFLTSSDSARDREAAERLGATAYITKPSSLAGYAEVAAKVKSLLAC